MRLGIKAILLIAAVILFFLAAVLEDGEFDAIALGLGCLAGSLLVGELNLEGRRRLGRQ